MAAPAPGDVVVRRGILRGEVWFGRHALRDATAPGTPGRAGRDVAQPGVSRERHAARTEVRPLVRSSEPS